MVNYSELCNFLILQHVREDFSSVVQIQFISTSVFGATFISTAGRNLSVRAEQSKKS